MRVDVPGKILTGCIRGKQLCEAVGPASGVALNERLALETQGSSGRTLGLVTVKMVVSLPAAFFLCISMKKSLYVLVFCVVIY